MPTEKTVSLRELIHFTKKQEEATQVADAHKYTLFGGSAGPGKSYWLRWYMVRTLIKWGKEYNLTGIRAAMFCEDYPTLKDRQISKMEVEFPSWLGKIKETKTDGLAFYIDEQFGGHVLMLRNLDDPAKYLSSEFAMVGIEEMTQNEEIKFHRLRSRLRWTGIPEPKFVAATNPGGIGHEWVKKYFVDRQFPDFEKEGEKFAYVPAKPTDNPHLAASYILTLQSLPERMRKAYLEGSWDIFEGMFFCCDDKTEVFTNKGYRFFKDLDGSEKVASMDKKGKAKFYPYRNHVFDYDGKLLEYKTPSMDFCVTPNHRMYVDGKFIEAKDLLKDTEHSVSADFYIKGNNDDIKIPCLDKKYKTKEMTFSRVDFCSFLGWFLSEGSLWKRTVYISQNKSKNPEEYEIIYNLLKKMGFGVSRKPEQLTFTNKNLSNYLRQFGKTNDKFIPEWIFNSSKECLEAILLSLELGDGHTKIYQKSRAFSYFSNSEQMVDGVIRLATLLGYRCSKSKKPTGFQCQCGKNPTMRVLKSGIKEVPYKGKVYCVGVDPHHTILIRRNGRCIWTGNTEWDPTIHVTDPFDIPETWRTIRGIDPAGRSGTCSSHIYRLSDDGTIYVTNEHYKAGLDVDQHAREIHQMSEGKDIKYTVIDIAAFSKLGMPESTVEIFERYGVTDLIPADKKRIPGWNVVHQYLRPNPETGQPRLKIFRNCYGMIKEIPMAMHDTRDNKNPEDVMDFWDGASHIDALDELRYVLQTVREQVAAKPIPMMEKIMADLKAQNNPNFDYSYINKRHG